MTLPGPSACVYSVLIVNECTVQSWNQLQELLYEGSWREPLGRFRSSVAFRGMGDARENLSTSLMRLGGDSYDKVETHLLRNFRKYATRSAVGVDSVWNWLALAAHHSLPTRLLDWTYSPYVALHFATDQPECFDTDGVIWIVDYLQTNRLVPDRLQAILVEEGSAVFTADMLDRVAASLAELDALSPQPFVLFFEPPSIDDRIVNQFALFSLLSNPRVSLDDWLSQHPAAMRRLCIPAGLKWEIRDKLDQANITERVLFPGLDGLTKWLRRYYQPRPK
jgi:hypothetical protein